MESDWLSHVTGLIGLSLLTYIRIRDVVTNRLILND